MNWLYTEKGDPTFAEGMKVTLPGGYSEMAQYMWQELDQQYRKSLTSKGYSDIIFSIFVKK